MNEIGLGAIALEDEVNTSIAEQVSSTVDITSIGADSYLNTHNGASIRADRAPDQSRFGDPVSKFTAQDDPRLLHQEE